eukprot:31232-Pelagococcus_subviridis.AAC.7
MFCEDTNRTRKASVPFGAVVPFVLSLFRSVVAPATTSRRRRAAKQTRHLFAPRDPRNPNASAMRPNTPPPPSERSPRDASPPRDFAAAVSSSRARPRPEQPPEHLLPRARSLRVLAIELPERAAYRGILAVARAPTELVRLGVIRARVVVAPERFPRLAAPEVRLRALRVDDQRAVRLIDRVVVTPQSQEARAEVQVRGQFLGGGGVRVGTGRELHHHVVREETQSHLVLRARFARFRLLLVPVPVPSLPERDVPALSVLARARQSLLEQHVRA